MSWHQHCFHTSAGCQYSGNVLRGPCLLKLAMEGKILISNFQKMVAQNSEFWLITNQIDWTRLFQCHFESEVHYFSLVRVLPDKSSVLPLKCPSAGQCNSTLSYITFVFRFKACSKQKSSSGPVKFESCGKTLSFLQNGNLEGRETGMPRKDRFVLLLLSTSSHLQHV